MAEAGIGLAASLVSLAAIFKACVDSFELYKAAEHCEETLDTVLVELDCEKERLLIWAEAIGLVQLESGTRHPDIEKHEKVIKAALEQIRSLLSNATKLQERYGIKVFDDSSTIAATTTDPISKNSTMMFKIAYKRFISRLNSSDSHTPSLTMKIRWAIRDRAKFMGLIVTLKGFVDRLFQIIPVSREVQDTMVEADIFSILDLSQLRLVEAACEGSYRAWSDIASIAIDRTERETVDQRTHRDDQEQDLRTSFRSSQATTTVREYICQDGWYNNAASNCLKLFVAVERCDSFEEPPPCSNREPALLETDYPLYLAERYDRWNLGRRLASEIDLSLFTSANINDLSKDEDTHDSQSLVDIRIYVAPCKRQISTAVSVCHGARMNMNVSCYVRIDDRLSASCCSTSAISERLESLLSELDKGVYNGGNIYDQNLYECIDRLWLEQRLYEMDGETGRDPISLKTQFSGDLRNVYDCTGLTKPLAAILLIGESDLINKVMNTKPFYASPRVVQPNQFFRTDRRVFDKKSQYVRKFLGSIDVNRQHRKAQAPTLPISPPASQFSLKRGPETDLVLDSRAHVAFTRSEPESDDLYN